MFNYEDILKQNKIYIIAEIGANHNGDMKLAKRMIDAAKKAGADCVKFQSWTKDSIFSKGVYEQNYFLNDDYRNREDYTLEQIVDKYHIGLEQHVELKRYCDEIGIDFNSTPFSNKEVDLLVDVLDVPFIKVASMDLENVPLLKYMASKGKPIILSTGLGDLKDIYNAVKCLEENGAKDIALLHCVSIYPPKDYQVNLNNIDLLKDNFNYPVGYSDHTLGTLASVLSIAKGAIIIEKHFTLDKNMEGWDHKVSADYEELETICKACTVGKEMLGQYNRIVNESLERRNAFKRSIVAAREISCGQIIQKEDLDYKRPGTGISPKNYEKVIGKKAIKKIESDEVIQWEDIE